MSVITDVESLANQLPALIEVQKAALAAKQSEMETLKNAGLIYANVYWRSGKYLYLIYPSHDGQRERKYIGANPTKIEAAKASIRRANEYNQLASEAGQIERKLQQGGERLRDAVAYFSGQWSW